MKQESKALRNDIFALKQENIEFKKHISLLIKENKELKKEIIDLKIQKQGKIKESDFSEILEKEIKKENIGQQDKKLVAYDPKINEKGNLIYNKQIVIESKKRNKILLKIDRISRISGIILAKKKPEINDTNTLNHHNYIEKTFKRKTFPTNYEGETKLTISSQTKFVKVVLAMIATKRLYSKDRLQFRRNRLGEKGGVVDFAWEKLEKKAKFQIKKCKAKGKGLII